MELKQILKNGKYIGDGGKLMALLRGAANGLDTAMNIETKSDIRNEQDGANLANKLGFHCSPEETYQTFRSHLSKVLHYNSPSPRDYRLKVELHLRRAAGCRAKTFVC